MEKTIMKMLLTMGAIVALAACGGGSSSDSSSDDSGSSGGSAIALTGTVQAPSASLNLSKGLGKTVADAAASSITGHVYTMEGEDLGTFTTASDGSFSVSVDVASLKGSDDTGSTFTEEVVCTCDNGIEAVATIEVTEGSTTSVSVGEVDTDTTLVAASFAGKISGWSGWGQAYKEKVTNLGLDMKCWIEAQKEIWENAASSGEGLADESGKMKETIMGFMAAGKSPSELGYSNWGSMMKETVKGEIASDKWSSMASSASSYVGIDASTLASSYSGSQQVFAAFDGVFESQFKSDGLGTSNLLDLSKAAAASASVCDSIKDGTLDPAALVKPMLAASDLTEFQKTYGDAEGIAVHFGLLEECMASAAGCDDMKNKPGAYFGYMDGFGGDFSKIYAGGTFDTQELEGAFFAAGSCAGDNIEEMKDCAMGVHGTLYSGGEADWSQYMTSGTFDANKFDTVGSYWVGQVEGGFDPATAGSSVYTNAQTQFGNIFTAGTADEVKSCTDALMAQGVYDMSSCFDSDTAGVQVQNFNEFTGNWQQQQQQDAQQYQQQYPTPPM